ncbi:hypothetical protein LTR47_011004 [Exophiala xenobiotica]|nr:hypothetical protein LTR41_008145 [Exophiala xenobiotica]KAK5220937.1 hypothetical protein LTR47_011004 [Exophiala xenobiotica]KAK5258537.1 hypothetical protein LTR40_007716 [Exophiala xenobiotica]KAK5321228.1 hypothetical protein LTR93_006471 [Exophiala xenobiotica]KAK5348483.1 hypothetical protein LTR61_007943 [Exophiala xenobiotica]
MAADFSSLTGKFRANLDSQANGGNNNKVSKRNRQPLSCAPCRVKKLRCDRGHPCETCVKKGDTASCTYGKSPLMPSKPDDSLNNNAGDTSNRNKAQERLRHLEQLVMRMVDNDMTGTSIDAPKSSDNDEDDDDFTTVPETTDTNTTASIAKEGQLQHGSIESRYAGSTHWSAILQNIQELKSALISPGSAGEPSADQVDPSLDDTSLEADGASERETFFGSSSNLSLAQILATSLPPREQVDRRLSTYFNARYMVIPFIHTWQFQRQYEVFWTQPLETSPLWLSILFSICCLSATLSEASGFETRMPEDQPPPRTSFLSASCQCLRLGGFIRPKRFVVEALALYTQCLYSQTLDPSGESALVWAMLIRQAYRSGYHRDSSQFPSTFSVFETEMRRRVWAMLRQFDLMSSFQLGLPNQIPRGSWDTQDPRNLLDADFDEHTTVLPPSRPETEPTQILYFIVKSRLMTSFGRVCAHSLSFRDVSQAEVMALDREVRSVHATVPDVLRIRPMSKSFADPSYLVMVRINCEFLFQKSLCVLHRKYMTTTNAQTGEYTHPESVAACTNAASAITRHMLDLHKEFKPGGQLYTKRWMLTSFTMNDFYLASMVLCLAMSMWKRRHPGQSVQEGPEADEKTREIYALLTAAFGLCEELSQTSTEAKRVADVLRVVLGQMDAKVPSANTVERDTPAARNQPPNGAGARARRFGSTTFSVNEQRSSRPYAPSYQSGDGEGDAPATIFTDPHNFNLAPLTLDDNGNGQDASTSTSTPNLSMGAQMQMQDPNYQLDDWNLGLNNPFTSFLPFVAPAYQNTGPNPNHLHLQPSHSTSTSGGPSSSSDYPSINLEDDTSDLGPAAAAAAAAQDIDMSGTSTNSMNTNMNTCMDYIDWAFLDQWMALPNPSSGHGISLAENQMLFDIPSSAPPAKEDPSHHQTQQQPEGLNANGHGNINLNGNGNVDGIASGESENTSDWTSTPYRFLGGEILINNAAAAEDARDRDRAYKAQAEAGQRQYEIENGMDNSNANQSQNQNQNHIPPQAMG